MVAGSPGVGGMSNSSSSSGASWRSGTPSPPLSEEGVPTRSSPCPATSHPSHNQPHYPYNASGSSSSSTPGSTTLDEGIVPDYIEEQHPRKKVSNLFLRSSPPYSATLVNIVSCRAKDLDVLIGRWFEMARNTGVPQRFVDLYENLRVPRITHSQLTHCVSHLFTWQCRQKHRLLPLSLCQQATADL